MSLLELWREFAAGRRRAMDEHDRDMTLAWHVVALVWQKKLPPLQSLLARKRSERQTPTELRMVMQLLSDQLGIPLQTIPLTSGGSPRA